MEAFKPVFSNTASNLVPIAKQDKRWEDGLKYSEQTVKNKL